jgi:hypothetical protein
MHPNHIEKISELADSITASIKLEARRLGESGAVDLETYDPEEYALAKILITAAMRNLADNYAPLNRRYFEDLENLKHF